MRLDQRKFREWLKAKRPDEIVGEQRACNTCPIALFYRDTSGGYEVSISDNGEGYRIDRGYSTKPLPLWANRFAWEIDSDPNERITAGHALEVMKRI